jgi:hypothetical protein
MTALSGFGFVFKTQGATSCMRGRNTHRAGCGVRWSALVSPFELACLWTV